MLAERAVGASDVVVARSVSTGVAGAVPEVDAVGCDGIDDGAESCGTSDFCRFAGGSDSIVGACSSSD